MQDPKDAQKIENILSKQIIDAAIEVHKSLGGPGLLESLYEEALYHELKLRDISVQSQIQIPVTYKNIILRDPLRVDLLVDQKVIVEIKATEKDNLVYQAQILTYLRLTGLKLGLLINFGRKWVVDGITRVVNGL